MWKDYSSGYVKRNRASSVSIMIAAFIATLFLSLLCNLAYNFWLYEIETLFWKKETGKEELQVI